MRRPPREPLVRPEPLEAILSRSGENRFARVRPPVPPKLWREAVGARIAERASPTWLHGGVLVLRVPSSVWAHELSLLADEICARLRERGVDARALRFRVGPLGPLERPPERRTARSVPTDRTIPSELAPALGRVADDALRAAIAGAAATNLAWQSASAPAPEDSTLQVSAAQRAVRAPRSAGARTCPPDPASPGVRADERRTREGEPDRSR
jgi:hypothetical protein